MGPKYRFPMATLLLVSIVLSINCIINHVEAEDNLTNDLLGLEVDEIVRLKGYNAREYLIETEDGYILSLIRCTNPLINRGKNGSIDREILVILHGTLSNNNYFVLNSRNARPENYEDIDLESLSEEELNELFIDDPARENLPMLALNSGSEVWFVNRRGSPRSRRRVDGKDAGVERIRGGVKAAKELIWGTLKELKNTANPIFTLKTFVVKLIEMVSSVKNGEFWDYSLDEQAAYDIPAAVDFILKKTKRKNLTLLGHSTGGSLILMALANEPKLAKKISKAILWAPAADLGHSVGSLLRDGLFGPLTPYIGPIPPIATEPIFQKAIASICSDAVADKTLCKIVGDIILGESGPNVRYRPELATTFPKSVAARELAQLSQSLLQGTTRYFNFGSKSENLERYGQEVPPEYEFSEIRLRKMMMVTGKNDALVGPGEVLSIASKLSFKPIIKLLAKNDKFNHLSYFANSNCSRIIIVPTLKYLLHKE